jgi:hypothetical protein
MSDYDALREVIALNNGVVFAMPAIVGRKSYCGRSLIAPNRYFFIQLLYVSTARCRRSSTSHLLIHIFCAVEYSPIRCCVTFFSAFEPGIMDERGYVPVEWWIMSKTIALNPICKSEEGLTKLLIGDNKIIFAYAVAANPDLLLGAFANKWPLTKVLDIGGPAVKPSFTDVTESPPIPWLGRCHTIREGPQYIPLPLEELFSTLT